MEEKTSLETRAKEYFEGLGIDPAVDPGEEVMNSFKLDAAPEVPFNGSEPYVITQECTIEVTSILFYTYCEVTFADNSGHSHTFKGHSGGLGVGHLGGPGLIYYPDLHTLLATRDFGVVFASDDGGAVHVTWGTHGNADAFGVGDGGGAFGGKGKWS